MPEPTLITVALGSRCPRCGAKGLFAGLTQFAPQCPSCGLDTTSFNVGDGPAAFLTMIVGAVAVGAALWLHFRLAAPIWVIFLVLVPLVAGLVIFGLRAGKAALLAAEYKRRASEAGARDVAGE